MIRFTVTLSCEHCGEVMSNGEWTSVSEARSQAAKVGWKTVGIYQCTFDFCPDCQKEAVKAVGA